MNAITPKEAKSRGLVPLTVGFSQREAWMLSNVQKDMERGGIPCAVVESSAKPSDGGTGPVVEVWRSKSGFRSVYAAAAIFIACLTLTGCQGLDDAKKTAESAYDTYNRNYERELRVEAGTDGKRVVFSIKPRDPRP